MIATPLATRGGAVRRRLAPVVVAGLATSTLDAAARRWGARRAGAAAAVVGAGTWAVERIGSTTGRAVRPRTRTRVCSGPTSAGVPAVVPGAWWAMALPAREAAHAALGSRSTPARRVALGALALTAWDLFLDPQMVGEGYWRWAPARPVPNGAVDELRRLARDGGRRDGGPGASTSRPTTPAHRRRAGGRRPARRHVRRHGGDGDARVRRAGSAIASVAAVGGAAMLPIAAAATTSVLRSARTPDGPNRG